MQRRHFISAVLAAGSLTALSSPTMGAGNFEVTRSDAEWRAMLSDLEYRVMRKEATERTFS